ncbi:hypothetical protein [Paenibacillus sp. FSL R7-0337]|uniref:hypothetical protein n=1 Tax=Paenibacillus sp. FSL R7-0337 TaxID=1926588 RepID=UPI00096D1F00|nr:hypothetical protein [Paenibacillus sp. FSL R7-0337]OMF88750.1 hypothetical protein BK147_26460 [Paenibacillus sp. FSL R7-0337]
MGKRITLKSEFQALTTGYAEVLDKLKSSNLTNEERMINSVKLNVIKCICDFIDCIRLRSEKHEVFLDLCLGFGNCTNAQAKRLGYSRAESLRFAKSQFRMLLEDSVFNSEKFTSLIQSNSVNEVLEVLQWYQVCVFDNVELLRPIGRGGK